MIKSITDAVGGLQGSTPGINAASAGGITGAEGGPPVVTGQEPNTPIYGDTSGWGKAGGAPSLPPKDWMTGAGPPLSPTALSPAAAMQAEPSATAVSPAAAAGGPPAPPSMAPTITRGLGGETTVSIPSYRQGGKDWTPPGYTEGLNKFEGFGKNKLSSAFGEGQFIDSTFRDYLKEEHPELGDPKKLNEQQLQKLKLDYGHDATQWYAAKNAADLLKRGLPVTNSSLYTMHLLGPGDGIKVLSASPDTPLARVLSPDVIGRNVHMLSGKTVGQLEQSIEGQFSSSLVPQQPVMTAPPQRAIPTPTDFTGLRNIIGAGTTISPQEHTANVLAGLAGGAGSVAANAPGSFTSALAAAGAGGGKGYAQSFSSQRAAMLARAEAETKLLTMEHQQENERAEISFANASDQWKVLNENAQTQYKNRKAEFDYLQPKVDTAGGVTTIQRINPMTGATEVTRLDNKSLADQGIQIKNTLERMKMSPSIAESEAAKAIVQQYQNNPQVAKQALIALMVDSVVDSEAGPIVFGDAYAKASKAATAELNNEIQSGGAALALTKPDAYQAELRKKIKAHILQLSDNLDDPALFERASKYSSTAGILAGHTSRIAPDAMPKNKFAVEGY
jgi:hypothetical protein